MRITMRNVCFALASFFFIVSLLFGLGGYVTYRGHQSAMPRAYSHPNIAPAATPGANVLKPSPAGEPALPKSSIDRIGDFRWTVTLAQGAGWFDTKIPVAVQYKVIAEAAGIPFEMMLRNETYASESAVSDCPPRQKIEQVFTWSEPNALPEELDWVDSIKLKLGEEAPLNPLVVTVESAPQPIGEDVRLGADEFAPHRTKILAGQLKAEQLRLLLSRPHRAE